MEESGQILEHLEFFNMLTTHLTLVGVWIDEEERCQILLCSLPDSWDSLVMAIGSTSVVSKMEDIVGSLLFEEMRRKVSLNVTGGIECSWKTKRKRQEQKAAWPF